MTYRCTALKQKIQTITDGEYSTAKREVDALRAELGQPPVPSLQQTLEEKSSAYVLCPSDAPLLFSLFIHFQPLVGNFKIVISTNAESMEPLKSQLPPPRLHQQQAQSEPLVRQQGGR